jgi:hypothetical protein
MPPSPASPVVRARIAGRAVGAAGRGRAARRLVLVGDRGKRVLIDRPGLYQAQLAASGRRGFRASFKANLRHNCKRVVWVYGPLMCDLSSGQKDFCSVARCSLDLDCRRDAIQLDCQVIRLARAHISDRCALRQEMLCRYLHRSQLKSLPLLRVCAEARPGSHALPGEIVGLSLRLDDLGGRVTRDRATFFGFVDKLKQPNYVQQIGG